MNNQQIPRNELERNTEINWFSRPPVTGTPMATSSNFHRDHEELQLKRSKIVVRAALSQDGWTVLSCC